MNRHTRRSVALAVGTTALMITTGATLLATIDRRPSTSSSDSISSEPTVTVATSPAISEPPTRSESTTSNTAADSTVVPTNSSSTAGIGSPLRPLPVESTDDGVAPTFAFGIAGGAGGTINLHPNGHEFVLGSLGGTADNVYLIATGDFVRRYDSGEVFGPKLFHPSGRYYFDGARLRDPVVGDVALRIQAFHTILGAGFGPDGSHLAVLQIMDRQGAPTLVVALLDIERNSIVWMSDLGELSHVESDLTRPGSIIRFAADGSQLYVGDEVLDTATGQRLEGTPQTPSGPGFWDPAARAAVGITSTECDPSITYGPSRTLGCDITPDGSILAVRDATSVRIWTADATGLTSSTEP